MRTESGVRSKQLIAYWALRSNLEFRIITERNNTVCGCERKQRISRSRTATAVVGIGNEEWFAVTLSNQYSALYHWGNGCTRTRDTERSTLVGRPADRLSRGNSFAGGLSLAQNCSRLRGHLLEPPCSYTRTCLSGRTYFLTGCRQGNTWGQPHISATSVGIQNLRPRKL
jgi:hypothetical protein